MYTCFYVAAIRISLWSEIDFLRPTIKEAACALMWDRLKKINLCKVLKASSKIYVLNKCRYFDVIKLKRMEDMLHINTQIHVIKYHL